MRSLCTSPVAPDITSSSISSCYYCYFLYSYFWNYSGDCCCCCYYYYSFLLKFKSLCFDSWSLVFASIYSLVLISRVLSYCFIVFFLQYILLDRPQHKPKPLIIHVGAIMAPVNPWRAANDGTQPFLAAPRNKITLAKFFCYNTTPLPCIVKFDNIYV